MFVRIVEAVTEADREAIFRLRYSISSEERPRRSGGSIMSWRGSRT